MTILIYCIKEIYIDKDRAPYDLLNTLLFFAIMYPTVYEIWKVYKQGVRYYLSNVKNYSTIIYLTAGFMNTVL